MAALITGVVRASRTDGRAALPPPGGSRALRRERRGASLSQLSACGYTCEPRAGWSAQARASIVLIFTRHPRSPAREALVAMTPRTTLAEKRRILQLETLVDLALALQGHRPEAELVEELLQRVCAVLDPQAAVAATRSADGSLRAVSSVGWPGAGASAGAAARQPALAAAGARLRAARRAAGGARGARLSRAPRARVSPIAACASGRWRCSTRSRAATAIRASATTTPASSSRSPRSPRWRSTARARWRRSRPSASASRRRTGRCEVSSPRRSRGSGSSPTHRRCGRRSSVPCAWRRAA